MQYLLMLSHTPQHRTRQQVTAFFVYGASTSYTSRKLRCSGSCGDLTEQILPHSTSTKALPPESHSAIEPSTFPTCKGSVWPDLDTLLGGKLLSVLTKPGLLLRRCPCPGLASYCTVLCQGVVQLLATAARFGKRVMPPLLTLRLNLGRTPDH